MSTPFPPTSRYALTETAVYSGPNGEEIRYLRRRFLPQPESLAELGSHSTVEGDRLDLIAAATIGDAEQAWQLADANRAMMPPDLVLPVGRRLRITLPAGIPGVPGA